VPLLGRPRPLDWQAFALGSSHIGKTARERLIPLHDEAADALRTALAMRERRRSVAARRADQRTGSFRLRMA
jgi:hypothetical protein